MDLAKDALTLLNLKAELFLLRGFFVIKAGWLTPKPASFTSLIGTHLEVKNILVSPIISRSFSSNPKGKIEAIQAIEESLIEMSRINLSESYN